MADSSDPLEELMLVTKAIQILPFRTHPSTLIRWSKRGVGGVKLETVRVGGRRLVSRRALMDFINTLTKAVDGDVASAPTQSTRRRSIDAAERELESRIGQPKPRTNRRDADKRLPPEKPP